MGNVNVNHNEIGCIDCLIYLSNYRGTLDARTRQRIVQQGKHIEERYGHLRNESPHLTQETNYMMENIKGSPGIVEGFLNW